MSISFYRIKEPGGFMSNFYPSRMFIYGRWWNWSEAPYQSCKTYLLSEKQAIWEAKTAKQSRELGQKVTMIPNWDQLKREVMKEVCMAKFLQHPSLRKMLMETGTEELIENSPVDWYWGIGADETGQNILGHVLMEIRTALQGE